MIPGRAPVRFYAHEIFYEGLKISIDICQISKNIKFSRWHLVFPVVFRYNGICMTFQFQKE